MNGVINDRPCYKKNAVSLSGELSLLVSIPAFKMATRDIDTMVEALTLEEKVLLLSGVDMWHVPSISRLGIGSIKVMIFDHAFVATTSIKHTGFNRWLRQNTDN